MKSSSNAVDELDYYIVESETTNRGSKLITPGHFGTHKTPILPIPSFLDIEDFIDKLKLLTAVRLLHFRKLRGEIDAEFFIDHNEKLNRTIESTDYELQPPPPPFSVSQFNP